MPERIFLETPKKEPLTKHVLDREEFWSICDSLVDIKYHRKYLLIFPVDQYHSNNIRYVSPEIWKEWGFLIQRNINHYEMKEKTIVLRFGDSKRSGNPFSYFSTTIHEPDELGPVNVIFVKNNTTPLIPTDVTQNQNLDNIKAATRSPKYHTHMKKTIGEDTCPFCDEDTKKQTCIKESKFW